MTDSGIEPKNNSIVALNSKRLRKAAYNAETKQLTVWSGRFSKIVYRGISAGIYNNLITAQEPDFYYFHYIHRAPPPRPALQLWLTLALLPALTALFWSVS